MNLNWLDFVIILILGFSVAEGIAKGFARVGIGLAAAIVGLLLGIWFYGFAGHYLIPYVSSKGVANFIGFWVVFLACLTAGGLLGMGLSALFKWAGLGWMDRTLGSIFGFARGLVGAIAIVLVLVAFTPDSPPEAVARSHWAPYLIGASNVLAEIAPRELKDSFLESYEQLKETWNEHVPKPKLRLPEAEI